MSLVSLGFDRSSSSANGELYEKTDDRSIRPRYADVLRRCGSIRRAATGQREIWHVNENR